MRRRDWKSKVFVASFLAPALFLYGLFVVWPFLQIFQLSLFRFSGVSANRTFVGPRYYQSFWTDKTFWTALTNGLILVVVGGAVLLGLAMLLGHASTGKTRTSRLVRSVYLFPQVISVVAVAVVWRFVFHPSVGVIKGPENGWLGDINTAFWVVLFVFVWMSLGFYVMLFGAGISSLPKEVDEAAQLEGVEGFKKFRTITWPMLYSVRRVAVVYVVINAMNTFALVNVMVEGGGPANSAEVMLNYLYEMMIDSQFGRASALAVVNFFVALGLSLLVMFLFRRNPENSRRAL